MKTWFGAVAMTAMVALTVPAHAGTTSSEETYQLLFHEGTLDGLPQDTRLVYDRAVVNAADPDAAARASGGLTVSFDPENPSDAILDFRQDGKHRALGVFPASVGNPMIMYHMETVTRDMAAITGGSQFYIRNRMKDALIRPAEITPVQVITAEGPAEASQVVLRPFADDPNAARMQGFDALSVTVVVSDKVPGWYQSLAAEVPGTDGPVYASRITFDRKEAAE